MTNAEIVRQLALAYPGAQAGIDKHTSPIVFKQDGRTLVLRLRAEIKMVEDVLWFTKDTTFEQIKAWVDRRLLSHQLGLDN